MQARSWAILPAAQSLFEKNKVSLKEIAEYWKKGTVVVCLKPNGQTHFIAGSSGHYSDLNELRDVHHDQNPHNRMGGQWKVINEVHFNTTPKGKITYKSVVPNVDPDAKACMAVFK